MNLKWAAVGFCTCCSLFLILFIHFQGRSIFDARQFDNNAVYFPVFSAIPLAMNLLADFFVRYVKSLPIKIEFANNTGRLMVLATLIFFNVPLTMTKVPTMQLSLICGQIVIFSSIMLTSGNCDLVASNLFSIPTFLFAGNSMGWLVLLQAFAYSKGSIRSTLIISGSSLLALVSCIQCVCLIRGLVQWKEKFDANKCTIQKALWFDFASLLHTTITWAICIWFNTTSPSSTQIITSLSYVQLIPILAVSVFVDWSDRDTISLAETVFSGNRGFIRYVSHELRSHLSYLSFGLLQLRDEGRHRSSDGSNIEARSMSRQSSHSKVEQKATPDSVLSELQETCDAAVQVLDEILVFDRLRDDVEGDARTLVEVKPLLRSAIDNLENLMKSKGTSLSLTVDLRNPLTEDVSNIKMFIDPDDMLEVLKLVLGNAVRVSPPSSAIQLTISLEAEPRREDSMSWSHVSKDINGVAVVFVGMMKLDVVDCGRGMSQDDIASLFRDVMGGLTHVVLGGRASGLGPSIAKALVERNGGTVAVSSIGLGAGCTFTIKLPVYFTKNKMNSASASATSTLTVNPDTNLDDSAVFKLLVSEEVNSHEESQCESNLLLGSSQELRRVAPVDMDGRLLMDDSIVSSEIMDSFASRILPSGGATSLLSALNLSSWAPQKRSMGRRIAPSSTFDFNNVADDPRVKAAISSAYQRLQADRISFFAYDELTQKLRCIISQDIQGLMVDAHEGIVGACFQSRYIVNIPWIEEDARHLARVDKESGYKTRSVLCSPILGSVGDAIGVVQALNKKNGNRFTRGDENTIRQLGRKMELLVQKCRNQPTFKSVIAPNYSSKSSSSGSSHSSRVSSPVPKEGAAALRTLRFLVVDDVTVDRKVLVHFLGTRLGHDVDEACDGAEALAMVQKSRADMAPFDAVFLDYVMPVMDGPTAARAMMDMGFGGRIIGLTAFTHANAALFMRAGVTEMFEKPLSFASTMKIVSELEIQAKKEIVVRKKASVVRDSRCDTGGIGGISTRSKAMTKAGDVIAAAAAEAAAAVASSIICRFLIVDDSSTSRRVLRHMLEKQLAPNHLVDEAAGGEEAMHKLEHSMTGTDGVPYDGVFLDYEMPVMDGAEVVKRMRAAGYRNEIVIFTGCKDPDIDTLMLCSVTLVIEKPLRIGQVGKIVQGIALQGRNPPATSNADAQDVDALNYSITAAGGGGSSVGERGGTAPTMRRMDPPTSAPNLPTTASTERANFDPKYHCLVVDDVLSNRKMVAKILESQGHTVVLADDGLAALAAHSDSLSAGRPFDFVFMDYVMPNMDGPTAAGALRRRGFERPIIGVTGNVLQADVDFFIEHGANAVLGKPVKASDVRAAMRGGNSK